MSDGAKRTRAGFNSYTEKLCVARLISLALQKKEKEKKPVFIFTTPVNRTPLEGMKYNNLHQP